jgi:hypothetical protein
MKQYAGSVIFNMKTGRVVLQRISDRAAHSASLQVDVRRICSNFWTFQTANCLVDVYHIEGRHHRARPVRNKSYQPPILPKLDFIAEQTDQHQTRDTREFGLWIIGMRNLCRTRSQWKDHSRQHSVPHLLSGSAKIFANALRIVHVIRRLTGIPPD